MVGNGTFEQEFTESDLEALKSAKTILENPSLTAQISDAIGTPIEKLFEHVPEKLRDKIGDITHQALLRGLNIAVASLRETEQRNSRNRLHKALAVGTGVTGGLFGVTALAVELPATTGVILRSIADIAQSEGHNLTRLEVRLACLEVFALGGTTAKDDAVEGGYWVSRAAMAQQLSQAAAYIAEQGFAEEGAPILVKLISKIAARYSIVVTEHYDDPEEARKKMQARQPHNRLVTPEEIAAMAAYLAADESASTIGACMIVDGGMTAR